MFCWWLLKFKNCQSNITVGLTQSKFDEGYSCVLTFDEEDMNSKDYFARRTQTFKARDGFVWIEWDASVRKIKFCDDTRFKYIDYTISETSGNWKPFIDFGEETGVDVRIGCHFDF